MPTQAENSKLELRVDMFTFLDKYEIFDTCLISLNMDLGIKETEAPESTKNL